MKTIRHHIHKNLDWAIKSTNRSILDHFITYENDTTIKRTHLFNERYENIYINESHIPELTRLLKNIDSIACTTLNRTDVIHGYWFNYMPPGATTSKHNHDDCDELLSGVYYVHVPADSGDLILYNNESPTRITPQSGDLILFPPDVDHEVTRNNCNEARLSIGINFGPANEED